MNDEILDGAPSAGTPHPSLRTLDVLVGTWQVSGPGHHGTVTYEWMPGGHFLVQHIDLIQDDKPTRGIEYIGYDAETGTLRSHYFSHTGDILEYVYEVTGREFTIWFGEPGSPARYRATFDEERTSATGAWAWPGGGYESTITRANP